jgi:hypothetical protein
MNWKKSVIVLLLLAAFVLYAYSVAALPPARDPLLYWTSFGILMLVFCLTYPKFPSMTVLGGAVSLVLNRMVYGGILSFFYAISNPRITVTPEQITGNVIYVLTVIVTGLFTIAQFRAGAGRPFTASFILPQRAVNGGVEICRDKRTGRPVVIHPKDRYLGTMVIGPPGSGKTTRVVAPMILQDLERLRSGERLGITIVEPKGDLVSTIACICRKWGIPYVFVDPEREDTARFNPLQGDEEIAAEATRTVLKNIFGKQEAFFSLVQETAARNTILMLKRLEGDHLDIKDVTRVLRDPELMKRRVLDLEKQEGESDLVQYFKNEVLGEHADKYSQFAMGLRMQLEDLSGNKLLSRVLCGQSDIDMDRHLSDGGVLLVNTAMGRLGKLGDTFGQFVVMHLQYAVFRRPGNEFTRIPHYLYIDEFPRYLNPYFNILLEIGRSYRCAVTVALQNTNQLDLDRAGDYRHTVLNGIRNIVVFGGLKADDAKRFEEEFGSVEVEERTASYDYRFLIPHLYPENYRVQSKHKPRFERVKIKELPQFHCIYRIVRDGQELPPGLGWCPFPKELRGINPETLYDSEPLPKEPSAPVDGETSDSDQDQPTREDFWDID